MIHSSIHDLAEAEELIFDLMCNEYKINGHSVNLIDLGWRYAFDDSKRRFGRCSPGRKLISLSQHLVRSNWDNPDIVRNTVLHEIAHAIHWIIYHEASHNYMWRLIARNIGCDGNRCYSSDEVETVESKYTLICPVCGHEYHKHRIPKRSSSCSRCSNRYDERFKLKLIQNY